MTSGKGNKKRFLLVIVAIVLAILAAYLGFDVKDFLESENPAEEIIISEPKLEEIIPNKNQEKTVHNKEQEETTPILDGELIITMIDVGQADSFLFQQNEKTMLVDCGTRSDGDDVVEYIKELGITKLDYVFGTHPHDDHMGGMYDVINNIEVGKIIIPEVEDGKVTSNWYEKLMTELSTGTYEVEYAKLGNEYELGDAKIKIIGQFTEYKGGLNNYSTVMKISFGEMDIIMTGDAETIVEEEILKSDENIEAEILKVGHHGSDTSTSDEFLDAVSPEYALISTEIGNKYEHPIKSVMDKLKKRNIEVYRTDESGTIVITVTSDDATFSKDPGDYLSGTEAETRYKK